MRGIAVVFVIIYHLNSNLLTGGFIGVDVFFVISGFLITNIIFQDLLNDKFSFTMFYARRIRRILPLMFTMLAVVLIVAYFLVGVKDFWLLAASVRANLLYLYNFYLVYNTQGYFSINSEQQPLIHTWSLAVEEQFYFCLPIALLVLRKISKKKTFIIASMSFLLLFSLLFSVHYAYRGFNEIAYYMLPSRAYELLIGSLLSICLIYDNEKKQDSNKPDSHHKPFHCRWIAITLQLLGITLVILSGFMLTKKNIFPGLLGLLPTVGAACFIWGGALSKGNVISEIFSNRILVGCGTISYSLYLWHWPVLSFYRYETANNEIGIVASIVLILIIILVSLLTYHYIEKPIRHKKLKFSLVFIRYQLVPFILLIIPVGYICRVNGDINIFSRQVDPVVAHFLKKLADNNCISNTNKKDSDNCIIGDKNTVSHIVLFGDSHASALASFFDEIGRKNGFSMNIYSSSACYPLLALKNLDALKNDMRQISQHRAIIDKADYLDYTDGCITQMNLLKNNLNKFDTVVMVGRWNLYISADLGEYNINLNAIHDLKNTLDYLKQNNKKVIIVGDIPVYSPGTIEKEIRRQGLHDKLNFVPISRAKLRPVNTQANSLIQKTSKVYSNVYYFDLQKIITAMIPTYPYLNNHLLYEDFSHLSPQGAFMLEQVFESSPDYRLLVSKLAGSS